jgi:hypothetical protein
MATGASPCFGQIALDVAGKLASKRSCGRAAGNESLALCRVRAHEGNPVTRRVDSSDRSRAVGIDDRREHVVAEHVPASKRAQDFVRGAKAIACTDDVDVEVAFIAR